MGSYSVDCGATECQGCPAGRFADAKGMTGCTACPAGKAQPSPGQTECEACTPGKYTPVAGVAHCMDCPMDSYSNHKNSTSCTLCTQSPLAKSWAKSTEDVLATGGLHDPTHNSKFGFGRGADPGSASCR